MQKLCLRESEESAEEKAKAKENENEKEKEKEKEKADPSPTANSAAGFPSFVRAHSRHSVRAGGMTA